MGFNAKAHFPTISRNKNSKKSNSFYSDLSSIKHKYITFWCYLPSSNEVCECYVFTRVSFCPRGGCLGPGPGKRLGGLARGVQPRPRGMCVSQHALRQTPPRADGYCCGRYASYWNAFLFVCVSRNSVENHEIYTIFWESLLFQRFLYDADTISSSSLPMQLTHHLTLYHVRHRSILWEQGERLFLCSLWDPHY